METIVGGLSECDAYISVNVCRPTNERERLIRSLEMIDVPSPREILVKSSLDNKMTKKFTFDRTFGQESEQKEVYKVVVAPLIEEVLSGYNCTVFAYGQTGTGKTHTMVGDATPKVGSTWDDVSQPIAICQDLHM